MLDGQSKQEKKNNGGIEGVAEVPILMENTFIGSNLVHVILVESHDHLLDG